VNPSSRRFRRLVDGIVLATLSIGAFYATARVALIPRNPERGVALVFAPWVAPETALTRTVEAGSRFVRFGGPSFITVAIPDDRDFSARALAAGAWLVVDPQALAACLSPLGLPSAKP
jgi:hypothetical protein